jgi:biopolymer transport protein ExbB/TolQ
MGGLLKHAFWVAPLAVIILILTWFLNRESSVEMEAESAAFDRDWNETMSMMGKNNKQVSKFQQRAAEAQHRYSSAAMELKAQKQHMQNTDREIKGAVSDIERKLK